MKLQNILGLLLATAALSACGGKDNSADKQTTANDPTPTPEIIPPAAESPSPDGTMDALKDKAKDMKESAEGVLDSAKDKMGEMKDSTQDAIDSTVEKAKEAVTN